VLIISGVQAFLAFRPTESASFNDSAFFTKVSDSGYTEFSKQDTLLLSAFEETVSISDTFELFGFDPNTVGAGDLRRLGADDRLIRTWLNYRIHGGRFYKATDIKKIYGMTSQIYDRLIPFVNIPSEYMPAVSRQFKENHKNDVSEKMGINTCDSADLLKINGIGPVLSGRIIRYRRLLGGYYNMEQLGEVYGLADSMAFIVEQSFFADTLNVQKININNCDEKVLKRHPYIGAYIARGIIQYRNMVQRIRNPDELRMNGIMTNQQLEKVKKYLVI
jgi:DNA uptake protein ComE-like DNA-binding protein